jgi:hypothetical protein
MKIYKQYVGISSRLSRWIVLDLLLFFWLGCYDAILAEEPEIIPAYLISIVWRDSFIDWYDDSLLRIY